MTKETIIKILMRRDDLTRTEAKEVYEECRKELANGNYNAIAEVCGLEDDYIFAFI